MGRFTEIFGSAGRMKLPGEIDAEVKKNIPTYQSKLKCKKCGGTNLTKIMGDNSIICTKCGAELA